MELRKHCYLGKIYIYKRIYVIVRLFKILMNLYLPQYNKSFQQSLVRIIIYTLANSYLSYVLHIDRLLQLSVVCATYHNINDLLQLRATTVDQFKVAALQKQVTLFSDLPITPIFSMRNSKLHERAIRVSL